MNVPDWMPADHASFLSHAMEVLEADARVIGVALGGSYISKQMDEYSDLDFVIVVRDENLPRDGEARKEIAEKLGPLLTSFTAEHVGEPRLLICLYGAPLFKVDLKFVLPESLEHRVEDPTVLYDPQGVIAKAMKETVALYPSPDWQRIEDGFWVWLQYAAAKIRRGELLEARAILNFIIEKVLGPLALFEAGQQPAGVRRLEFLAPDRAAALARLYVGLDKVSLKVALLEAVDIYLSLRGNVELREGAQLEAVRYLAEC
jgi:predicted nucleotidyltransferase